MLERLNVCKCPKTAPSTQKAFNKWYLFYVCLGVKRILNMAMFPSSKLSGKPVQIMESKMNSQLTRITGYEDR